MWSVHLVGAVLISILCCCAAQDYDDWIQTVTNENDLGRVSRTFNCSNYPYHPRPTIVDGQEFEPYNRSIDFPESWMLPNLTIVNDTGYIGGGKIWISDDKQSMTINNVTTDDFGIYHCLVKVTSDGTGRYYLVKWGVNMRGPYFEDLWLKYRTNTIIAFSASGGFTAFMIIICLVYQYRWKPPGEESSEKDRNEYKEPYNHAEDGKVNPGFVNDYQEPTTSTASNVFHVNDKPPLPSDGISAEPAVTYSTFTPVENVENQEVEADTRF